MTKDELEEIRQIHRAHDSMRAGYPLEDEERALINKWESIDIFGMLLTALDEAEARYISAVNGRRDFRAALKEERAKHRCEYCDSKPSGLEKESREVDCRGCGRVTGFEGTQCSNCGVTL
jgi:ribosomal protein L37AE/L43A